MANSTFSVIGPDVVIRGNIEASADLHVDGQIIGDITCASLVMGDTSSVQGEVVADSARISGAVSGTVRVGDLVVLRNAKIDGDVSYDTISIEQGAAVNGTFASPRKAAAAAPVATPAWGKSDAAASDEPAFTEAG